MDSLGVSLEKSGARPPIGWTWHHAAEEGVMQLVPRMQHSPGSEFWNLLHPGSKGGFSIWGK